MSIWGALIGGTAGMALGGPIGGLLGAMAGHVAETQIRKHHDPSQSRKVAFTVAVIALSAKMAKADGLVTHAEISAFRRRVHIPPQDLQHVGKFWDLARQTTDGFQAYAHQTVKLFGERSAILEQLLDLLFTIARSDGDMTPPEWAYLREVASIFGYDDTAFDRLSAIYGGLSPSPYLILGVPKHASETEIKQAWKALVRAHHPDQLIAAGMPEEFIQAATDRLAKINAAYELLRKQSPPSSSE